MNILTKEDFSSGGRFDGVPVEIAEKLVNEVNSTAAQYLEFERQFQQATIEVMPQLAKYDPAITAPILAGIGKKVLERFNVENISGQTFFRDSEGKQQLNDRVEPATAGDLFKRLTLDLFKPDGQAATNSSEGKQSQGDKLDLSAAKSRVQVDEIINAELIKRGISKAHPDYNKLYQEAKSTVKNFAELPLKVSR